MTPVGWDGVVAAALLGTARGGIDPDRLPRALAEPLRRLPSAGPDDAAARLLDVAALATVYRRAGMRSTGAPAAPQPPPAERGRRASEPAQQRLAVLLATNETDLLALWLGTAAERGLLPAPRLLPRLLDLAARSRPLAGPVAAAVGERGRWLAVQREDWARALRVTGSGEGQAPGDGGSTRAGAAAPDADLRAGTGTGDEVWRLGSADQRLAWLRELRRCDPGAARDLLAAGWSAEAPDQRGRLLQVLDDGLTGADEPLLQRCLGDRRGEVRGVAAELLRRLPDSAFARRAAARALAAVRVERHLLRRQLVVDPPRRHDKELAADQIPAPPARPDPTTAGPAAWLLLHVVAAAPLHAWVPALATTPAELVGLDVADGRRDVLWQGWARAVRRERDAGWASALLGVAVPRTPEAVAAVAELIGLLTPADQVRQVPALLADPQLPLVSVLDAVAAPWPAPVADAALRWLARHDARRAHDVQVVLELAGRRMPVDRADALTALAGHWPPDSLLHRRAAAAATRITTRRDLLEELQ